MFHRVVRQLHLVDALCSTVVPSFLLQRQKEKVETWESRAALSFHRAALEALHTNALCSINVRSLIITSKEIIENTLNCDNFSLTPGILGIKGEVTLTTKGALS